MNKKIAFIDRIFIILSITFFIISIILLIINCFMDVIFELLFVFLFAFIFLVNQIVFLPGKLKVYDREWKNLLLYKMQFYTAIIILIILLFSPLFHLGDTIDLFLEGTFLMFFLILYSLQNYYYSYNFDMSKKRNLVLRVITSVILSIVLFVSLFYSLFDFYSR